MSKSIRRRLIIVLLVSVSLPMLIMSIMSYTNTRTIVRDMMLRETQTLFDEGKNHVVFYFDVINRASLYVYRNQIREQHLATMLKKDYDMESERFFYHTLTTMKEFEDAIVQVYMYLDDIQRSFLLRNYMVVSEENSDGYTENDSREAYIKGIHLNESYRMKHIINIKEEVITFHRNIYEVPLGKRIGQVSIDLNARILQELFGNLYSEDEYFYLVDRHDGIILYASESKLIGQAIDQKLYEKAERSFANGKKIFETNEGNNQGIVVVNTVEKPYMDLMMVKVIPQKKLNDKLNQILSLVFFILSLTTIIILVVSVLVSYYFTKPINELLDSIQKIRKGNLDTITHIIRDDEFGRLQYEFNDMMEAINNHIDIEYKLAIENTSNELKALQGQINSHFMNNILQSIGTESLKEGNLKVYELVVQLGQMMQYAMRNQHQIVELRDEVAYCVSYLKLQKHRFGDAFDYEISMENELEHIKVPKLLLQPIIENCFKHAFKETEKMGNIHVIIKLISGKANISILDNGSGIEADQLAELKEQIKSNCDINNAHYSIGLKNVYKRLKFYYKDRCDLFISSTKDQGTCVQLTIPTLVALDQWFMVEEKDKDENVDCG
ncbi:sensor histidine kinase [Petrocella sp. FN5]|uniref:sensor histidine kinase n=1 Tax=Petrocella sp. FN5 TaxID=3032002 RepID=UPI0023DA6981|nr:histidine kinase [Petrocella sp. FN5]MDF1617253.1 histidine kinase [Petrocella sp. FN5]